MAGAYDFKIDFSPLGEIIPSYQASRQQKATEDALSGLKSGKYQDVQEAAAAILRGGGSIDQATKLYNAATANYAAKSRAAEMEAYYRNLPGLRAAMAAPGAAPTVGPIESAPQGAFDPLSNTRVPAASGAPPATAPSPFPPPPTTNQIPPGTLPTGPRAEAPQSPTEAIITKAQAGMDPTLAAPATKLAGPPPTPDTSGSAPLFMQSVRQPTPPGQGPAAAPQPAPQQPAQGQPLQVLQSQAAQAAQDYLTVPRNAANSPAGRVALDRYKTIMGQLYPNNPKWNEYQADRLQRRLTDPNGPDISFRQWNAEEGLTKSLNEEVMMAYGGKDGTGGYRGDAMTARKQLEILDRMDVIMKNPNFNSGTGVGLINMGISGLSAMSKLAEQMGIPVPDIKEIQALKGPIQSQRLADAFTSLSNQMIFARIHSLGTGISEGDRNFVNQIYPSLLMSPEGNRLLSKILRPLAQKNIQAGDLAEEYRLSRHPTQANAPAMDRYVREGLKDPVYFDEKGNPTKEGRAAMEEYQAAIDPTGQLSAPPPPAAVAAPPPPPVQQPQASPTPPGSNPLPVGQMIRGALGIKPYFDVTAPPPAPEEPSKEQRRPGVPRPYLLGPQ